MRHRLNVHILSLFSQAESAMISLNMIIDVSNSTSLIQSVVFLNEHWKKNAGSLLLSDLSRCGCSYATTNRDGSTNLQEN